jgi:hypothetical protein
MNACGPACRLERCSRSVIIGLYDGSTVGFGMSIAESYRLSFSYF